MPAYLVLLLFIASGVLLVLASRALSWSETSRTNYISGILGMVIAVGTTLLLLFDPELNSVGTTIVAGVSFGSGIVAAAALRPRIIAPPTLVA
ncbi:MAG: NAD synthetase, partial [Pseudomonadota bacterium]